jgi:site-specific DNA-cytosine methylase
MTFADLFCGAGGLSVGLVVAWLRPLWTVSPQAICCDIREHL